VIRHLNLGDLLHVFEAEDKDPVLASHIQVSVVDFELDDLRKESYLKRCLVRLGIINCKLTLFVLLRLL
jgi:hypothetical protein